MHAHAYTHTTTENTPDQWPVWNAGFVSSHSGHFHSRAVCESVVVFQFPIGCQLIGTIMLCVGREYIGCHTIILLCLHRETSAAAAQCHSGQKMKISHLIYCTYYSDVGNWVTISCGFKLPWRMNPSSLSFDLWFMVYSSVTNIIPVLHFICLQHKIWLSPFCNGLGNIAITGHPLTMFICNLCCCMFVFRVQLL